MSKLPANSESNARQ